MKIFITRKIPDVGVEKLKNAGHEVSVWEKDEMMPHDALLSELSGGGYDAVLTLLTDKIDSSVFDAAPTVKIFVNYATGFDNIDIVEAKKRGIVVANSPAELTSEAVAEHTVTLVLALSSKIVEADRFVREGKYKGWDPNIFVGSNITGKTLGLIGAGRIGEKVSYYAKGLGLNVIYSDMRRNDRIEKECGAKHCESVEEVLKQSDIISLHTPLLPETRHLINSDRLRMMKKTALLVNTSRGAVVDEVALEEALRTGVILGAALDVFEFEPQITPGLLKLENTILTPHIASASVEVRDQMAELAAQNILEFAEGKKPTNQVN